MAIIDDLNNLQTSIVTVKKVLADNIKAKGVSVSENDTLTTLSNAVKDIPQGGGGSVAIPEGTKFAYSTFQTLPNEMVSYMNTFDNYQRMYSDCDSMVTADMSSLTNISNAKEMTYMFNNNNKLEDVIFPEGLKPYRLLDTFRECKALTNVNIEDLDLSECITLRECFYNCSDLTTVTLPTTLSEDFTTIYGMFKNCSSLTTVTLPTTFPSDTYIDCESLFERCTNLSTVNNLDKLKKVKNIKNAFRYCTSGLTEVVWNDIDYSGDTIENVFDDCKSLNTIEINNGTYTLISPFNVGFFKSGIKNCSALTTCSISNITINLPETWNGYGINASSMFEGCSGITEINLSNWTIGGFSGSTTDNINDIQYMFKNCTALTTINFSGWNMLQCKLNSNMFQGCNSLSTIIMNNCSDESIAKMQTIINNNGKQNQVTIITDDI